MPVHIDVTWVALECKQRQESPSDEVYGTVNGIVRSTGESISHKFPGDRSTWEMGERGERIVTVAVPLYSGPPVPLDLMVTLAEHDSGDIEAYKRRVAAAVAQAAGAAAAAFTSGASAAAQPIIDELARGLVDVAADVLRTADDAYNPATRSLTQDVLGDPNRPRDTLRRDDDPRTAEFTDMILVGGTDQGGDFGEYAFYFDVRVTGTPDISPPLMPTRTVRLVAHHSGKVLDVLSASMDNGAPIIQFDWHGGDNQRWRLQDVGGGLFKVISVHSGKVLDVTGFSMENSAPIIQFDFHGGNNQLWRIEDLGDGLSKIVSAHSGKVLDVDGASTDNFAPIVQFDFVDGPNQKWLPDSLPAFPLGFHPTH